MAPENLATTNVEDTSRAPPTPITQHLQESRSCDSISPPNTHSSNQQCPDSDVPHDITSVDMGSSTTVPFSGDSTFHFPPVTRSWKRNQCKNACTNCQKMRKRCDDSRPCQRCICNGTVDTCVDSKRKERKKGLNRGPYKKRNSNDYPAQDGNDVESGPTKNSIPGHYPNIPYIGPVHYPPDMWNAYAQPGMAKYYHPIFTFPLVTGPPWLHTGNATEGGQASAAPHFPIGCYPTTLIPYPASYPHYSNLPSSSGGSMPHGFHYAYPPFPGVFLQRHPYTTANHSGDSPPNINSQGSAVVRSTYNNSGNLDSAEMDSEGERDTVVDRQDVEGNSDASDDEIVKVIE